METDEVIKPKYLEKKNTIERYHKSTRLIDDLVVCWDALCSKEINKEKLDLTSEFWLFFTFQGGLQ